MKPLDLTVPADITASRAQQPTVSQLRQWRAKGLRLLGDDEGKLIMAEVYDMIDGQLYYCGEKIKPLGGRQ